MINETPGNGETDIHKIHDTSYDDSERERETGEIKWQMWFLATIFIGALLWWLFFH